MKLNKLIAKSAIAILTSLFAVQTFAAIILLDGVSYNASSVTGFFANRTLLESQIWWHNSALATRASAAASAAGMDDIVSSPYGSYGSPKYVAYNYALDPEWLGGSICCLSKWCNLC